MPSGCTFGKQVPMTYERALSRVAEELACNPELAHRALEAEPEIGALLPCNVVVRVDDAGKTRIDVMDPDSVLRLVGRADVAALAAQVRERL